MNGWLPLRDARVPPQKGLKETTVKNIFDDVLDFLGGVFGGIWGLIEGIWDFVTFWD